MCGRFTMTVDPAQLRDAFPWLDVREDWSPRYNIAPTQPVAVVPNRGDNRLDYFLWGLIPSWAKDPSIGNRLINARAETLAEKASFRNAFRRRRCLVLADGFFEWKTEADKKRKQPMYIRLKTGEPFGFAGLWEIWNSPDGSQVFSCTIITTEPNELVSEIHNRMPVILKREDYSSWLDPAEKRPQDLQDLLTPYPSGELEAYPVSTMVNSPANDDPGCVLPLA
ncbi:MAG: SOS response-associated peptidase [Anaerolineales bacterium]|jgi:putative SOS response-associated peptidase YedK